MLVATALGVYQYNSQKDIFEQLSQFPNNCRIQTLFEDHDGVIWAGTSSKGLYYYNPATSQHGEFKLDTVNTSRTINNIYEDRKNNFMVSQLVTESKFMTVVLNKRPNTICKMAYLAM